MCHISKECGLVDFIERLVIVVPHDYLERDDLCQVTPDKDMEGGDRDDIRQKGLEVTGQSPG